MRTIPFLRPQIALAFALLSVPLASCASPSTSSSTSSSSTPVVGASTSATSSAHTASVPEVLKSVASAATVTTIPTHLTPSLEGAATDFGLPSAAGRGCQPGPSGTSVNVQSCIFGDPSGNHTIVVLGDSHAGMWLPAFDLTGQRAKWRIISLNKVNCGAAAVSYYLHTESRPYAECDAWHNWAFSEINKLDPSIVILTSFVAPSVSVPPLTPSAWTTGLESSFGRITSPGTKKVVLGDIPYLVPGGNNSGFSTVSPADCVAAHESNVQACSVSVAQAELTSFHNAELQGAEASNAQYIDVIPWLCSSICVSNYQQYLCVRKHRAHNGYVRPVSVRGATGVATTKSR